MRQYSQFFAPLLAFISLAGSIQAAPETSPLYPADGANYAKYSAKKPPLLPTPQRVEWEDKVVELSTVRFSAPPIKGKDAAQMLLTQKELASFCAKHGVKYNKKSGEYRISFKAAKMPMPDDKNEDWRASEAYMLIVGEKGATVSASGTRGFFYGIQTLKQLMVRRDGKTTLPLCKVFDYPDLKIRGVMNDCGRNFMPISMLKKQIDAMAELRFNVYHFHMTDNHGWRLESKKYPQLKSAKNFTRFPGEIYTQKEYKEFVEYCRQRNIMVIPELDMPGHTAAFRMAMKVNKMEDPKVTETLVELIKELGSLTSVEDTPYIHIGTDEAKSNEHVSAATLEQYYDAVASTGRRAIHWSPGMVPNKYKGAGDDKAIEQLWFGVGNPKARPTPGGDYIDSQDTYINHIDAFECAATYFFRRPCPYPNANGLGFILCSWPDIKMSDSRHHFTQTPLFVGMAFCSQSLWHNPHPKLAVDARQDELLPYYSNLPAKGSDLLKSFAESEDIVLAIRDRFFTDLEFPYVRQANVHWKILGPIPNGGDVAKEFDIDKDVKRGKDIKDSYSIDGKDFSWDGSATGHTVIYKQYCTYPTPFNGGQFGTTSTNSTYYAMQYIYSPKKQNVPCWISGQHWPASDRSYGGPNTPGQWHHSKPVFYVNGKAIPAPKWSGNTSQNVEEPLTDENYFYRKPTMVPMKEGWNQIVIKSPCGGSIRRWMFTFAPILPTADKLGIGIREFPGLKFSTEKND
ncbi:MAG: family 20 glycosylhydrolase [Akkermansia sp.]